MCMSRVSEDLRQSPHNPQVHLNGSSGTDNGSPRRTKGVPEVAVVGAGLAGLRCADILVRAGIRVTIFEARDRVGGRVHQMESGGYLVDMGPNWIHGSNGNPITKLAERTNTLLYEPEEGDAIFDFDGTRKSDDESRYLIETVWFIILQAFKYSDEQSSMIDPSTSLLDFFEEEVRKREIDPKRTAALLQTARMWGAFVGDPIERQSLKFFFLEECIDADNVFVAGTYKGILNEVASTALSKAIVHFNSEITHYRTTTKTSAQTNHVTLTTASGITHHFDEVVITCPLGWLKRNKATAFSPALPPRLSQAIDNISYGHLEKIYVTFPSAFWLSISGSDSDSDSSSGRTTTTYPFSTQFFPPASITSTASAGNEHLVSLAHLPGSTAQPTLLFYLHGPTSTYLSDLLKPHPTDSPEYTAILTTFTKPYISLLPGYTPTPPTCHPTSLIYTNWQSDPFAGNGSYTNMQVGLEEGDQDVEVMREGMGKERGVWLAGEHTAPFVALGTTTGAYWSGEGVGRRICAEYGLDVWEEG